MTLLKINILLFIILIFNGCSSEDTSSKSTQSNWLNVVSNTTWQWQLNGKLNTSYDIDLYDIDLFDTNQSTIDDLHSHGKKIICYFSAGSYENWRSDASVFPDEVKGNDLDNWAGEKWLDISKIDLLKPIMIDRLNLAKSKKCDGVEPDNVDGYTNNTGFNLTFDDQLQYNIFLAKTAHTLGLSIGLKNDINQIEQLEPYFDFAVNEQCNQYNECDKYTTFSNHNKAILNAEYNDKYLDDDNMTKLCNYTNNLKFSTLILPIDLNDTFRYDCKDYFYNQFKVGYGGAAAFKFYDNKWFDSTDLMFGNFDFIKNEIVDFNETQFNTLSNYLQKSKYMVYWVTKGWSENWFDLNKTQEAINNGKIPIFVYWYFGDEMINGITDEDINDYIADTNKLKNFLEPLQGEHFVILEPEFNKPSIIDNPINQTKFISAIKQSATILKKQNRKLSLCMMDTGSRDINSINNCGYENCSYGDKSEWSKVLPIYNALLDDIDFISFQQMIGEFSRDDNDPGTWDNPNPKAYTNEELGIDNLAKRIDNFATYLKNQYHKPVFLPYIAIATATWNDDNNDNIIDDNEINASGWIQKAQNVYRDLNSSSLFGYAVMELFDNPTHDDGGYQYFMKNEYHLGIITSDINNSQLTGNIKFKGDILNNIFKQR